MHSYRSNPPSREIKPKPERDYRLVPAERAAPASGLEQVTFDSENDFVSIPRRERRVVAPPAKRATRKQQIIDMHLRGMRNLDIALTLECSDNVVASVLSKWRAEYRRSVT